MLIWKGKDPDTVLYSVYCMALLSAEQSGDVSIIEEIQGSSPNEFEERECGDKKLTRD